MRKHRPRTAATALILAAAPLLAGCFAGSDPSSSGTSGDGARLRVAMAFPPAEKYSPYGDDALLLTRLGVAEGLTALDGNGAAAPALATSWTRENDRSWLFTLRDARFQDGGRVTAGAVVRSLDRAEAAEPAPRALTGTDLDAEAVGDDRVRISTATPDPTLPLRLSSPGLTVFSANAYKGRSGADPVGTATGPFRLTNATGSTKATLERFDGYWGGRAQASGVDVSYVPDGTARANALRSGEADIAEAVPAAQAAGLEEGTAKAVPTARTTGLLLNTASGPFKDPALRAAAREGIDASTIADDVYEGYADPGQGLLGPAVTWAGAARQKPAGRAAAARPDGAEITIATYDNRPELPEVAQVLQQQLRKAGFKVSLVVRELSRLEDDALAGRFDGYVGARSVMVDTGDPVAYLSSDFTCDGTYNIARLCTPATDRAVGRAAAAVDTAARQRAVMAAEAAVLGTDAVVPLVHQRIVQGVAENVEGVRLDPFERTLVGAGTRVSG